MATRSTIRYNYRDYLSIPEGTSRRHEIVDGALFVIPSPRSRHQEVITNLAWVLGNLAREHGLGKVFVGPIAVRLHDEGVVEPDVIFVREDRLNLVDPEAGVDGPPDLVVEVLSPSNPSYDRGAKRKQYLDYGVPELWIVDADEGTIEVWRPGEGAPTLIEDVPVGAALAWRVGDREFSIRLGDVLRG